MARVFLSSTYQDLRSYREAVYVALRRLGHQSVAMEDYAASDCPPIERSLGEVENSDIYIGLFAWRYGYIPSGYERSITELELRAAQKVGLPCLIFLLDETAPWPAQFIDRDPSLIRDLRRRLLEDYVVGFFRNPDELALQVATALHQWVATGSKVTAVPVGKAAAEPPGPDVFLSYAHEDLDVAELVAGRIAEERWSVFWDRTIPVGLTWDEIVESALESAKCVVVLWSGASRRSEWVLIEATEGADRGILAPAMIEETKIPLRFRRLQAADLIGWRKGRRETSGVRALVDAIGRCIAKGTSRP